MIAVGNAMLVVAIASVLFAVACALTIGAQLQARGVKIDWIWFRVFLVSRYLGQYREVTRRETGHTGWPYHGYVIGMLVTLVTAIAGLVLRAL